MSLDQDDPLFPSDKAAQELHQSEKTLTTWRSRGKGPQYVKSGRRVFYRQSALREFIDSQVRTPEPASARRGEA